MPSKAADAHDAFLLRLGRAADFHDVLPPCWGLAGLLMLHDKCPLGLSRAADASSTAILNHLPNRVA